MVARLPKHAVLTAGVVFGIAVEWVFYDPSEGLAAAGADLAVGCILIACGVIAWDRRPESRVGLLVALGGVTWFLGNVGTPLVYLHRVPLVALLLSYPTGRAFSRLGWGVTAAVLVYAVIGPLARDDVLTLVACGAVSLAAASLFGRSSGPIRKARGLALGVTVAFTGVLAVGAAGRLVGWRPDAVLWTYDVVIAVGAVVLIVELVKGRWAEAVVTGLVVDLGAAAGGGTLSGKLAHALGDPSLIVAYRLPNGDGFVDEAGRSVTLPSPGSGRTVTGLVDRGEQVAVLVHDETLLADPQLAASVAAAARVALANASLHAAARARAAEVAASRRRIVEAAAVERLEIQRQLQRGAGRRLETVASVLADICAGVGEADATLVAVVAGELEATRLELQEFARGLHPATLTGGGLVPALAQVAERSPIPVEVRGTLGRLPTPVEAALFFVCSEALANVAKHAAASVATIDVRVDANGVTLEIADDGRGGADAGCGSGLAGLVDRVEALGGRLRIESEAGRGTRLVARLPLRNGRASAAL